MADIQNSVLIGQDLQIICSLAKVMAVMSEMNFQKVVHDMENVYCAYFKQICKQTDAVIVIGFKSCIACSYSVLKAGEQFFLY